MGMAIESQVALAMTRYITAAPLDAATWQRLQQQWRQVSSRRTLTETMQPMLRLTLLDLVQAIHRGEDLELLGLTEGEFSLPTPTAEELAMLRSALDWEEVLRTVNHWVDRYIEAVRISDPLQRKKCLDQLEADMLQAAKAAKVGEKDFCWQTLLDSVRAGQGQSAARALALRLLGRSCVHIPWRLTFPYDRIEEFERLVDVVFALARYRDQVGKYPERLEQLVPQFLPRIEPDIFSGKPPIYRRSGTGYVLYSVGPNGQDDGGRTYEDNPRGDDIVIRMPPTPPPHRWLGVGRQGS